MGSSPAISVIVNPDSGCASVLIASPTSLGRHEKVDLTALVSACRDEGIAICEGVRRNLNALLRDFLAKPREIERVIARPIKPVDGKDGYIKWMDACDPTQRTIAIDEEGRVDHYAVITFIRVEEGQHIANLRQPTSGTDGRDVYGKTIPATPGKPCPWQIDAASLHLNEQDGAITTLRSGVVSVDDNVLAVRQLLEVKECVDFSTGHIDFEGCVDIREDVRDLFRIKATGSVSVRGLIEAAMISCEGNFVGQRGMVGRGRGSLHVKGDAEIGFLNTASGTIGGILSVRREIIDCNLAVDGGLNAKQCAIIGGTLDLRGKGVVGTLGSLSDRRTHVVLTSNANLLVAKMIHPKVLFQLGDRAYEINRATKGPVRIVADTARTLAYRIADGIPRPLDEISSSISSAA